MKPTDPAFPHVAEEEHESGYHATDVAKGLTKRECFAAKALQGLLASSGNVNVAELSTRPDKTFAFGAVMMADALLAELAKPEPKGEPK